MSQLLLNIFTQNFFRVSNKKFLQKVHNTLNSNDFEKDLLLKKVTIGYLHQYITQEEANKYLKAKVSIKSNGDFLYTHPNHCIYFKYSKNNKPSSNYLININIVNTYSHYVLKFLISYQKKFIESNSLIYLRYCSHQTIIKAVSEKYNTTITSSQISNVLKKTIFS